jgi:uncharacterized phage-associated protein
MARAIDVARYLIQLAAAEDEPDCLSPLRLQKLLYYAQGWSLANRGEPLFPERIEAWAHGPVVPDVWQAFRRYGYQSIPAEEGAALADDALTDEEREFIVEVWEAYKAYSATSLRSMTHRERPWLDARSGYAPGERCEREITRDALRGFFSEQAEAE